MSVLNENQLLGASAAGGDYEIEQSLRFDDGSDTYLSRTPSVAGNRKTWTWSGWVKRGNLGSSTYYCFYGVDGVSPNDRTEFVFTADAFEIYEEVSSTAKISLKTTQLFRDPSAWYHVVIAMDTTQATNTNRVKFYVNGEQVTSFSASTYPSLNYDTFTNSAKVHVLGARRYADGTTNKFLDGYLAEVNLIDGQALTPDSFGETGDYGEWKPTKYAGTYGTNGFNLKFENASSLGNDSNGSNNWTPTNLAATDQMVDSPTNNFATLNPLWTGSAVTLSEGNCKAIITNYQSSSSGTQYVSSGKRYFEVLAAAQSSTGNQFFIGVSKDNSDPTTDPFSDTGVYGYYGGTGNKRNNSNVAYGAVYTTGDLISVALDLDAGTLTFYKNGVSQGEAFSGLSGSFSLFIGSGSSGATITEIANFGADSSFAGNKTPQGNQDANSVGDFFYPVPNSYLALCTSNLPEVDVIPSEHFNTVLYSGTGSTQSITGVGFQPDMFWAKTRNAVDSHALLDSVRGGENFLYPNLTDAEWTDGGVTYYIGYDSDGVTLNGAGSSYNLTGRTYASWNWKAGGTASSNTNGSITSSVSANPAAGFSIVSYTGNATAGATVGHGLTLAAPEMFIVKSRGSVESWMVSHTGIGNTKYLQLNAVTASATNTTVWNNTSPTSSVFSIGTNNAVNTNSNAYIAYCFHSVDGYSKIGTYKGTTVNAGPFVHTGFRVAFVLIKTMFDGDPWVMMDAARDPFNVATKRLRSDSTAAETTDSALTCDFLSNGFKPYGASYHINGNNQQYMFLAFAESPFKHTNAR